LAKGLIHSWRTLDTDQPVMEILSAPSDQDSLEVRLGKLLFERKLTLATAESCTGGLIGHWLTNVPGSSEYYIGGVVSYAYEAKVRMLGVSWDLLKAHGAVSAPVVKQMAKGVRELLSTDLGLSVSGIAGPGGATPTKPVGYAWVGLSSPDGEEAFELQFHGDRIRNKESIAQRALELVMEHLEKTGQD
jgi:PncC family amidohydrolase